VTVTDVVDAEVRVIPVGANINDVDVTVEE
jgi:hypothetical protein